MGESVLFLFVSEKENPHQSPVPRLIQRDHCRETMKSALAVVQRRNGGSGGE
jgi:hypothetical protein